MSESISTSQLFKTSPKAFMALGDQTLGEIRERLKDHPYLSEIHSFLSDQNQTWYLHRGDLIIDRSFNNDIALVVDGNVRIAGIYDDYGDGATGELLVLGDMQSSDILSWGTLAVTGSLRSDGIIYAYYNDYIFEVSGDIEAAALLVADKSSSFDKKKLHTDVYVNSHELNDDEDENDNALRRFVPEVIAPLIAEQWDDALYSPIPDWDVCSERLHAGLPVLRSEPAPIELREGLEQIFDLDYPAAKLAGLIELDPLLAMVVALREDIPETLQDRLIAGADPVVLSNLAQNPELSSARLARIASLVPTASADIARHPNAPAMSINAMAHSEDPEVRLAALERTDLAAASLEQLAADPDSLIRERLLWSPNVYRLSADAIERLVNDTEADIKRGLTTRDGLLQAEQIYKLARDNDPQVREAVAQALVAQTLWQTTATLNETQRQALAEQLFEDQEVRVRYQVVAALPLERQTRLGLEWLQQKDSEELYQYLSQELAATTLSKELIQAYADSNDREILQRLATNPALPETIQIALLKQLQPPQTRPRLSILDNEVWNEQRENSHDIVAEALLSNSNVSDQALLELARYCAGIDGRAGFCIEILHQKDLPAAALSALSNIWMLDYHEDWALTVLRSPRAERPLLEQAVPVWYDDEAELLQEFESFAQVPDQNWWQTLATAKHARLRELASNKTATPTEILPAMADDDDEAVLIGLLSNPNFPQDHALYQQYPHIRLYNPATSDQQLQAIIEQARAAGDLSMMEDAWKILAARHLKGY